MFLHRPNRLTTILKKWWLFVIGGGLLVGLLWLAFTNNPAVWPIRNTLQYHALIWWWDQVGRPQSGPPGTLSGVIRTNQGAPISGARMLVSEWDGTTHTARSDEAGRFGIENIPAGTYRPVAGAPGYANVQVRRVEIKGDHDTAAEVILPPETPLTVSPGRDFKLGELARLTCTTPLASSSIRRAVTFDSAGQPNQPAFYYTPVTTTSNSRLPLLLAVYPGPADSWECASLPLTEAGYAVLAAGPAYSFDLEADVDELARLLEFARQGLFPGSDPAQMALLGGSYSSLHVQRLLQRGQRVQAALLLGPPTDLFEMRRRLEEGTYIPPFGLDKALIALGLPSQEPLRYWQYSGAYHVRADFPPLAILHSRSDEVVPYQQSELLAANLAQVGAPYEVHFFDGASHYLLAENADEDTLKIYRITLDFLAKYLH